LDTLLDGSPDALLPSEVDPLAMGGNPEHVADAGLVERFDELVGPSVLS
jgi:hypothetical protein